MASRFTYPALIAVVLLTAFNTLSASYINENTIWKAYRFPPEYDADGNEIPVVLSLEGPIEWEGYSAHRIICSFGNNNTCHGILRTEGSKVLFLQYDYQQPDGDKEWLLLYDFGLTPGERTIVYPITYNQDARQFETMLECVGTDSELYPGFNTLVMREYFPGESPGPDAKYAIGHWIEGLGGAMGLTDNCHYAWEGGLLTRSEVWNCGELVFLYGDSNVRSVKEKGLKVVVRGMDLDVSEIQPGSLLKVLAVDGSMIGEWKADGTSMSVSLPSSGIYLLCSGTAVRKIMVSGN